MDHCQASFLGLKRFPRELTDFEIEAFFTFTLAERALIEERRRPEFKLGLALQIGFLSAGDKSSSSLNFKPRSGRCARAPTRERKRSRRSRPRLAKRDRAVRRRLP